VKSGDLFGPIKACESLLMIFLFFFLLGSNALAVYYMRLSIVFGPLVLCYLLSYLFGFTFVFSVLLCRSLCCGVPKKGFATYPYSYLAKKKY
jgi:hypothetical protein